MALIRCPECAREISDRAVACPQCGNPMPARYTEYAVAARRGRSITIQATGKPYKALQALGAITIIFAVVSCTTVASSARPWSGIVFLLGAALYACGRIGAWWNHG